MGERGYGVHLVRLCPPRADGPGAQVNDDRTPRPGWFVVYMLALLVIIALVVFVAMAMTAPQLALQTSALTA